MPLNGNDWWLWPIMHATNADQCVRWHAQATIRIINLIIITACVIIIMGAYQS